MPANEVEENGFNDPIMNSNDDANSRADLYDMSHINIVTELTRNETPRDESCTDSRNSSWMRPIGERVRSSIGRPLEVDALRCAALLCR